MVQGLAVDVQHERGHRGLGVRALGRTAGAGKAVGAEAADAGDPRGVDLVEPGERGGRVTRVVVLLVVDGLTAAKRAPG